MYKSQVFLYRVVLECKILEMINDIKFGEHTIQQLEESESIIEFMQTVNYFSKK